MAASPGMANQKTPGDLIIDSLEDLKGSEFKKFQNKLSDFSYGDKLRIPRGKLENAGWIPTKDLLIDTYGEEGALDVVIEVFKMIDLMGPAENLQKRREENAKLKIITNNNRLKEWRKEYMESMKDAFQRIKEHNTPKGETVSLEKRYTKLKLIKGPQIVGEKMNDAQGRETPQNVKKKSNENLLLTIQTLFDPDSDQHVPKIVVLQGPAGIGKTMTSQKIMLDWASGNLYQEFDFVFHLSCRELNNIKENISLIELLSRTSRLQSSDDLVPILKDPGCHGKLLFVVDGFDELKWTLEEGSQVCRDAFGETHKDLLLQKLLMKEVLKQSSLIITTRPLALGKLHSFVEDARHVQILGFAKEDCVEYFHNFFKNETDAEKALSLIKDHDILNTLCEIPIVCWIVCTVMKLHINQDFNLQHYRTITSIYLLYLKGLIKHHVGNQSVTTCLRKLCALAKEGVLNQKMIFDMEDLDKHGLSLSELGSVFLNEKILFQDIDTQTCYTFIHLSVQEFLAALYYVLDDGSKNKKRTTGRRMVTSIPKICKGNSLSEMCVQHPHLTLSVRFLFGLINEKEVRKFSESTGINISSLGRRAMQDWLTGNWLWKDSLTGNIKVIHCSEAFSCLYETQDLDIIKRIMPCSSHLELFGTQKGDFWSGENCSKQLCYCLMTCGDLRTLSFTYLVLDPKYLQMLSPLLHGCHQLSFWFVKVRSGDNPGEAKLFTIAQYDESPNMVEEHFFPSTGEVPADLSWLIHPQSKIKALTFNHCGLTASACDNICTFMKTNKRLTCLDLSDNKLRDSGVKILCEGLKDPGCTLKELRIWQCHLTHLCCEDLHSLLVTNRSLTSLNISINDLRDAGIKHLCEGLKDPRCALQILNIHGCSLSPLSCDDLQSVLISNRSLITLVFSISHLDDSGIKVICEGLKHPECTLKELSATFNFCQATLSCFGDICSAISTNQTLSTLEICIQNELEISETEHCFQDLQNLGCIVQKVRPCIRIEIGPEGGIQKEMKMLDIIYKKTPLAN